jgi:hypothetical protein
VVSSRPKNSQQGDLDLFLTDHALQFGDLVLFLFQLIVSTEGLAAVLLEFLLPI